MARVLNGSHSFTCTPRVHPLANGMNHTCLCLQSRSWYLFTELEGCKAEFAWVAG